MTLTEEQDALNEYIELIKKLFNTGELTEAEWQRRFALHQLIAEIGSRRGAERRRRDELLTERIDEAIRIDANLNGGTYLEKTKSTHSVFFDGRDKDQKARPVGNKIGSCERADVAGAGYSRRCENERNLRTSRSNGDSCAKEGNHQTDIINASAAEAADYYAKLFDW